MSFIKKLIITATIAVAGVIGVVPMVASAQAINNLWKISSGVLLPVTSTWSLKIPQLGGSGTKCLQTDNNGLISVAVSTCGGSGSQTPWTSNIDGAGYNLSNAGTITGTTVNATSTTATSTISGGFVVSGFASTTLLSVSGSASTTFTAGINIKTGCFAINGTCFSGGGGGSGGGTFSTTTSTVSGQLINYPNNTTDIVVVGASATTTAGAIILNPNTGTSTLQNVIAKSLNNYTVYADQFSGATAGAKIAAATSYICPTGGTVDARGLTGVQTISTASYTLGCLNGKAVTYIFGATTYNVVLSTTLLTVYSHVTIIGQASTTFQTSVSAPTATGVGGMFTPYYDTTKTGTITAGSKSLTVSDGSYFEPGSLVAIVGAAGGNQYQATTLNFGGGIDNATTSIPFTSTSGVSGANYWLIDSEIITGTVSGNYVIGVTRGALGSSAASHSDGATITWMGDLITRVKSVSGTTITLEDAATQSVTSAPVTVGSTDINFLGSLTLDGRQNRDGADVLTNPTGIFARLASKIHVDPTVNFKNFDHMGVMLQASWDNDLWDSEATGIGRPSDGLGFAFLGFGQSKYNHVHASNVRDSFIGVSFDDRSTTLTEFDGTPQYNEIWLDNYEATSSTARGFGIVLQGAQNTTVHTGHIYAPSDSCITLNSLQWNTIPPVQNNVVYAGSLDCSATVADDANSINNTVYYQRSSGSVSLVGRTKVIQDGSYFLNQQVGIGTSTPIGSLEIASNTPRFYLTDLNAASNNHIYLENLGGKFVLSTTSPTDFSDRSTPLFSFDTSGNFAINNATPAERVDFSNGGSPTPSNLKLSSFSYFGSTFSGIAPGLCYNAKVDTTSGVANQFRVANTSSVGFGCITMTAGGYNFFASSSSSVSANSIITPSTASQFSVSNIGRTTFAGDITVSTTTATSTLPRLSVTDYASTSQLMVSGSATSTFTSGVNIKTGCFAVNGTCVGGGSGGTTNAGGSDTQVQFNDGGTAFGGDAGFTYDKTADRATLTYASTTAVTTGTLYDSGLGTARIPYISTGGLFVTTSGLQFDDTSNKITVTYASSTALTVSGYSYLGSTAAANVEIGTTTGTSKLNVAVTSGGAVMEADSWDSSNFNTVKFYNDQQLGIAFTTYGSAYGFASIDNVGKNGTALYVNGGPFFAGTSILARVDLGVNSTPVITISSSSPSKVGVASTSPSYPLSVTGKIYSTATTTSPAFEAYSTTATSTFGGGINVTGGCIQYMNECISQEQNYKTAVQYATVAALTANVYANGSSGRGATLTGAGVGGLSVDGTSVVAGDRILVKNESTSANNGIYQVTAPGSGIAVYVLTRASDFDQSIDINPGDAVFVMAGGTLLNTSWAETSSVSTMGTDAITFAEVANGAASVSSVNASGGTTGLSFSGGPITSSGTLTLGGTLNVLNGGTGGTAWGQGWFGVTNTGAFTSSTSPTVNYITATSTTATSTFYGGASLNGYTTHLATTTFSANVGYGVASTTGALVQTVDWSKKITHRFILQGNTSFIINSTSSSPIDGGKYIIKICQPTGASNTVTFASPQSLRWSMGTTTATIPGGGSLQLGMWYESDYGIYNIVAATTTLSCQ